jgi:type IV secretory pathway VirB2 component (pilin)
MLVHKKISLGMILFVGVMFLVPELSFAAVAGGFESKMNNLQNNLINVVMPLMAILGLVYAGILAATGNESARGKIILVLFGSIMAFLAPHVIGWIKAILG